MIAHRFAAAAERGDRAAMASLFAEDVTYHTPVTTADLHGRDLTLRFLAEGTRIVDDLEYTDQVSDDERTILFWKAILDRRELLGATVLADEAGGLIHDITVLQRPWGVVAAFRDATLQALADVVPMPAWQLDGRRAPAPDPNAGVGQRPGGSLRLAPTVAFHSPILTKTVYGQENVEAIQKLMDGIQGVRTYIARFTSKKRLVEYWNCAIDGHLQRGIDVFELDDDGRVTDQTVWLRPWPVVTLLRDRAMASKLPFLTPHYRLLPPPANPSVVAEDTEGRSGSAGHPLRNPGAGTIRRTRPLDAQAPESEDALPVKPALDGTVALVTGASSGIGAATAAALAAQGAAVALAARRKDRLDALAAGTREQGGTALALESDITDQQQATEAVERTVAELGRLDTLVNDAGVMLLGPAVGAPLQEWQQMVELNVLGLLYCAHAALPHLLSAAEDDPRCVADMANISSVAGRVARSGTGVYNLTKFGVAAFSESLRQELIDRHVRISLVEPGAVETELASHNRPEIQEQIAQRFGGFERLQPDDIAAGITFIVTRPRHVAVNEILIRPTEER